MLPATLAFVAGLPRIHCPKKWLSAAKVFNCLDVACWSAQLHFLLHCIRRYLSLMDLSA